MEAWDKFLQCFTPQVKETIVESKKEHAKKNSSSDSSSSDDNEAGKVVWAYTGGLDFHERKFREIRYGFVASKVISSVKEADAIRILQKAVRRWLTRRKGAKMRRKRGFMSSHGVVRMCGLAICFVMIGDLKQQNFTVTVKE